MSDAPSTHPKVFISYSWSTPTYKEQVLDIADRLIKDDRVEVIIDEYDLKGGQDVVAFMERLRTDKTISHVLVLSDATYAVKADSRKRGVGTEAQIISPMFITTLDKRASCRC
ncbi:MAG: SEFIR domain-containing protein [Chthoniobacteraceae bacterium]